jgi:septation ring formation regulator EzrA
VRNEKEQTITEIFGVMQSVYALLSALGTTKELVATVDILESKSFEMTVSNEDLRYEIDTLNNAYDSSHSALKAVRDYVSYLNDIGEAYDLTFLSFDQMLSRVNKLDSIKGLILNLHLALQKKPKYLSKQIDNYSSQLLTR